MNAEQQHEYYLKRKKSLMRAHYKMMAIGQQVMIAYYTPMDVQDIVTDITHEFEILIPQIPYIGGKDNPLTDTLEQMTSLLALYNVLKRKGETIETIGTIVQEMAQTRIEKFPKMLRYLVGRFYMTRWNRRRVRRNAKESQQHRYPGNFVYEVVADDGVWGINYLECGVVKFFHAQNADEFTPYMCLVDYLIFPAMGIHLQRQGTIAHGCTHCDFRFQQG